MTSHSYIPYQPLSLSLSFALSHLSLTYIQKHMQSNLSYLTGFSISFFFFNFWLHWVFVAARRLSLVAESGEYSSLQ